MIESNKDYTKTANIVLATTLSFFYPIQKIDFDLNGNAIFVFPLDSEMVEKRFWKKELKFDPISFSDHRRTLIAMINESKKS